ncbi:MAG: SDR family oxidoreductase [Burkholderiaceae bacterium]|nr:SDR family oxidoreductase [Burkholderiaceae bacterium]
MSGAVSDRPGLRAIVTGAARGIGRAMAERLAADSLARFGQPALLVLADQHGDELARLRDALQAGGARVWIRAGDLADADEPARIAALASAAMDGLDCVASNAGFARPAPLLEAAVDDWDRVFAVHVRAAWLLGRACHGLLARARGCLVLTTSVSGSQASPPLAAYSASKAAQIMLMKQMAVEWGPDGIRVNALSPGLTLTPGTAAAYEQPQALARREARIPLRRVARPEDMAAALSLLVGPDAAYIHGHELVVDGGLLQTLMPSLTQAAWGTSHE